METVWKAYKVFEVVKKVGVAISGIFILVMMCLIVYDVVMRNLFDSSIRGGFEIIQNYMMPLAVFPGLAYMYASGVLPKMDMLLDKVNLKIQRVAIIVMILIELFILVLIVQFSLDYAMSGLERKSAFPAAGTLYPIYPLYFIIPIAFGLIIIENIFILIRNILVNEPTLVMNIKENGPEELL